VRRALGGLQRPELRRVQPLRVRCSNQPMPLLEARGIPLPSRVARAMDGYTQSGANGPGKTCCLRIAPIQAPSTLYPHSTEDKKLVMGRNWRGCALPLIEADAAPLEGQCRTARINWVFRAKESC
jgi:hypothetical protein